MILASSFFLLQAASLAVALGIGRGSVGWDAARQASVQITSGNSPLRMRRSDHAAEGSPNSTSAGLRNVRVRTDGAGASAAGQPREMTVVRFKETPTVCETTPDVRSLAGYVDLDDDAHVFFWFFEARKTPETAPVTLWLNGGPGSDSLVGLFEGYFNLCGRGHCALGRGADWLPGAWASRNRTVFGQSGFDDELESVLVVRILEPALPVAASRCWLLVWHCRRRNAGRL